jgi:hypothetical protein
MNDVMKLGKNEDLKVLSQDFDSVCKMTLKSDADKMPALCDRISKIDGTSIIE